MDLPRDPRVQHLLETSPRWHTIQHHREVASTQDLALEALRQGATPGWVVVADAQTAGRGRGGRAWRDDVIGPEGPGNLAVTATVEAPREHGELVSLATGLAVASAYRAAGAHPRLKWPNDVLLGGRKASGVLVERHLAGGDAHGGVLLVGCGLDLDWRGRERAGEQAGWTSLAEEIGASVDRAKVLVDLLRSLDRGVHQVAEDPAGLLDAYRQSCATIGASVRVALPDGRRLIGEAIEIDDQGRLVVIADGRREHVSAGDVAHVRPG